MTETVAPPEPLDSAAADDERRPRRKRVVATVAVAAALIVAALAITGVTGLGGPGPIHRYPYGDLHELADAINTQAGAIRTPDDCWRTLTDADGPLREIAKVDYLRSRVVVRLYARQLGKIDSSVHRLSDREIEVVLRDHPGLTRDMIVTEPSPDGWSPRLTCRISSGSRIAGF